VAQGSEALGQLGQDEPASGMALEPLVGLCSELKREVAEGMSVVHLLRSTCHKWPGGLVN
jgi:hypothetical protein